MHIEIGQYMLAIIMSLFRLVEKWGLDTLKVTKDETKSSVIFLFTIFIFRGW